MNRNRTEIGYKLYNPNDRVWALSFSYERPFAFVLVSCVVLEMKKRGLETVFFARIESIENFMNLPLKELKFPRFRGTEKVYKVWKNPGLEVGNEIMIYSFLTSENKTEIFDYLRNFISIEKENLLQDIKDSEQCLDLLQRYHQLSPQE